MIDLARVIITGAEGMVGNYADFGIKTNRRSLDVTDLKDVMTFFKKNSPSAVVHLAAETDVERCERDPEQAYLINSVGSYNVASAAKEFGVKIVYISTAGIFDGRKDTPYTEIDEANPQNYYGRSKYLGELIVRNLTSNYIIARASWMFGGGPQKDQKFVAKIISQLNKPEIFAIDNYVGSSTFGKDLIMAIKKLLLEDKTGVFNLSNNGCFSRYEMAKKIVEILGAKTKVTPVKSDFFKDNVPRAANECLSVKSDLMRPWQEALQEYLETEWRSFMKK